MLANEQQDVREEVPLFRRDKPTSGAGAALCLRSRLWLPCALGSEAGAGTGAGDAVLAALRSDMRRVVGAGKGVASSAQHMNCS